jgi:hypothetical protein
MELMLFLTLWPIGGFHMLRKLALAFLFFGCFNWAWTSMFYRFWLYNIHPVANTLGSVLWLQPVLISFFAVLTMLSLSASFSCFSVYVLLLPSRPSQSVVSDPG